MTLKFNASKRPQDVTGKPKKRVKERAMTGWLRVKKQDMEAGLAATHAEGWGTNRPRDATMQGGADEGE